jgi:hypothetical protein
MLGEQIGHETGQITGTRVLPGDGSAVQVEASLQVGGTLLGIPVNDIGTYLSVARPDGTLFGQGQGVAVTDDGETVAWNGQGVVRFHRSRHGGLMARSHLFRDNIGAPGPPERHRRGIRVRHRRDRQERGHDLRVEVGNPLAQRWARERARS